MDSENYQKWWLLHLRKARGEILTAKDLEAYHWGLKKLDEEEQLEYANPGSQDIPKEIATSLAEIQILQEQNKKLDDEIARLAKALEKTRKSPQPMVG
jgi:hypothetical protein